MTFDTLLQTAILVFLAGGAWHDLKIRLARLEGRVSALEKPIIIPPRVQLQNGNDDEDEAA